MSKFTLRTPHAAVIVWNYKDRLSSDPTSAGTLNDTEKAIISTVSCVSIQTSKSKGEVAGSFQLVLAPYKNWVSTLTAGSWCCIMMSNKPIDQLTKADPDLVKMIGKIDTVRVETNVLQDGTRQTRYLVSGTDWGHIFNNVMYVDNLLASQNDPKLQGNGAAVAIRNALFGKGNSPQSFKVNDNLTSLINIFGNDLSGFTKAGTDINRLSKSTYDFLMPKDMVNFFQFVGPENTVTNSTQITKILSLQTGRLTAYDNYEDTTDAYGYLDPFSLQGTNTFWQILMDNSNPVLNEMFNEIIWTDNGPALTLYNRIKPFSYKKSTGADSRTNNLRSWFYNIFTHDIDNDTVMSVNAGTNWRDKYNFVEIKPQFQDFNVIANWSKQKTQQADEPAFNREGFRPLIVGAKQFPVDPSKGSNAFNPDLLEAWASLLREWYFDTHRLLNGTLVMTGTTDYIAVGENIKFDAGLINPTPNMTAANNQRKNPEFVLAHVESIAHSFFVSEDGARQYTTTIQFVRGIIVNKNNKIVGEGSLDKRADKLSPTDDRNTKNTVTTSEHDDPDPQKVKGK